MTLWIKTKKMDSNTDNVKTVVILLEFNDGSVRQVLANKETKMMYLSLLTDVNDGNLKVSEEIMPLTFEPVKK